MGVCPGPWSLLRPACAFLGLFHGFHPLHPCSSPRAPAHPPPSPLPPPRWPQPTHHAQPAQASWASPAPVALGMPALPPHTPSLRALSACPPISHLSPCVPSPSPAPCTSHASPCVTPTFSAALICPALCVCHLALLHALAPSSLRCAVPPQHRFLQSLGQPTAVPVSESLHTHAGRGSELGLVHRSGRSLWWALPARHPWGMAAPCSAQPCTPVSSHTTAACLGTLIMEGGSGGVRGDRHPLGLQEADA